MLAALAFAKQAAAARQVKHAGAEFLAAWIHHAIVQTRQRDHRLDGRAGRVGATQRAVEQRLVDIVGQRGVLSTRQAAGECRRIETRLAHQCQHVAVGGVDSDHRAAMIAERLFRRLLGRKIDRQHQVIAGDRGLRMQFGDEGAFALLGAPLSIDQDFAIAVLAVQRPLVCGLDPELADQRGAGVGNAVDVLQILHADGAHVPQGMHRELAQRIVPGLARRQIHARELVTMHREAADLLVGESQPHRYTVEGATRENHAPRVLEVIAVDEPERGQALERVVEIGYLLAHQLELVGRLVVGHHLAVAIEDQPAAGRDRIQPHPVALRQLGVIVVAQHLQENQATDQGQHHQGDHDQRPERALREDALLVPVVLDSNA